jgi:hypothetical protein
MWPFPAQSQLSDSSYLISGLAKHIGMQTGLHRPDNAHEYSYRPEVLKSDRRTKQSTWLACHFLDAFHSLRLGIPSTFVEDIHFLSLLENQETPAFLRHVCKAMRLTMTACRAMDDDVTHVTRAEKIKPYLNEFTLLKSTFSPTECPPLETLFLVCQLQLYSFVITEKTHSVHKIDLYHRAEQDAIQLIQIVYANIAEHTRFAPMYIIRSLAYAALILLWIQRSEYAIQKERIFESISTAMTILSTSSRYQKDEPHRALNLLVNFSQSTDIEKSSPVKNRMSATLLYESIRMSRENSREIINKLIESILNDDIVLLNNE